MEIIYNNVNERESDLAEYASCEFKIDKTRIPYIIKQLKRDKKIFKEFFGNKNIVDVLKI